MFRTLYMVRIHIVISASFSCLSRFFVHLCCSPFFLLQDTVTGFLLSGVGHRDNKNRVNYLVVDPESKYKRAHFVVFV